ncbi:hypothetical protein NQ317_001996, partial [Molorchus minor]
MTGNNVLTILRRSSATLLSDAGADITTIKLHGGGVLNTAAETYIEDCMQNKISIANKLLPSSAEHMELANNKTRCAVNLNNYSRSFIEHPELKASPTNLTHCNIDFQLQPYSVKKRQ